jgi:hypothetical protein
VSCWILGHVGDNACDKLVDEEMQFVLIDVATLLVGFSLPQRRHSFVSNACRLLLFSLLCFEFLSSILMLLRSTDTPPTKLLAFNLTF